MSAVITRLEKAPAMPKKTKVAAYARISETKGNTPESLSAQVSYYNELISTNPEWEFAGIYSDAGATGTNKHRNGFQELLKACEEGKVDKILTKSISRFARNTVDLLEIVRDLASKGIEVYFERENISSLSGDGELMLSILASFAQEESWSTSENVKWGIRKNFEKGITNQMCVYGYIWTGSEFIINETQAEAVRYIFKRFLEGARYSEIIKECTQRGWEAYWGGPFTTGALKRIITQRRYTGNVYLGISYNPYPGHHGAKDTGQAPMYYVEGLNPQIIDQETFDKAQIAFDERTKQNNHCVHNQTVTEFSGKVWCKLCNRKANRGIVSVIQGNYIYGWRCPIKLKAKDPAVACSWGSISEDRMKEAILLITKKTKYTPSLFTDHFEKIVAVEKGLALFHHKNGKIYQVRFTFGRYRTALTVNDIEEVNPNER